MFLAGFCKFACFRTDTFYLNVSDILCTECEIFRFVFYRMLFTFGITIFPYLKTAWNMMGITIQNETFMRSILIMNQMKILIQFILCRNFTECQRNDKTDVLNIAERSTFVEKFNCT